MQRSAINEPSRFRPLEKRQLPQMKQVVAYCPLPRVFNISDVHVEELKIFVS